MATFVVSITSCTSVSLAPRSPLPLAKCCGVTLPTTFSPFTSHVVLEVAKADFRRTVALEQSSVDKGHWLLNATHLQRLDSLKDVTVIAIVATTETDVSLALLAPLASTVCPLPLADVTGLHRSGALVASSQSALLASLFQSKGSMLGVCVQNARTVRAVLVHAKVVVPVAASKSHVIAMRFCFPLATSTEVIAQLWVHVPQLDACTLDLTLESDTEVKQSCAVRAATDATEPTFPLVESGRWWAQIKDAATATGRAKLSLMPRSETSMFHGATECGVFVLAWVVTLPHVMESQLRTTPVFSLPGAMCNHPSTLMVRHTDLAPTWVS